MCTARRRREGRAGCNPRSDACAPRRGERTAARGGRRGAVEGMRAGVGFLRYAGAGGAGGSK